MSGPEPTRAPARGRRARGGRPRGHRGHRGAGEFL